MTDDIETYIPASGRVLGESNRRVNMADAISPTVIKGIDVALAATAAPASATSIPCSRVIVQAATTNTVVAVVGGVAGQTHELIAGTSIDILISDVSKVYVKGASGTVHVTYFA